jgi:putative membrane-bound dehydrogenase-like protein
MLLFLSSIRLQQLLYWICLVWVLINGCQSVEESVMVPRVLDSRLEMELIASSPEIITPIGMAIDGDDCLYVLESHTHSPPHDYQGPDSDRIKKSIDEDQDGKPDLWLVFASGIENGVNLAIDQEGVVFVTTKKMLLSFSDINGDGQSDHTDTLVVMDPPGYVYDHAGLLGIALGPDHWVYVSRGNLGGKAWKLIGSDGSQLEGYGNGGIIFRCRKDGSRLEWLASGFWNPFDIKFTHEGRLLATDNDPDSRGPNRLIEVVRGGDYGFKCLYGGSGLHPYNAWNGELPGSLPFAAPLGEAPCALIDATFTNFGTEYKNNILVNIWEEKNIVRIPLQINESSVYGTPEVLVQGDTSFHPVALVTNSRGDLYISDWVLRKYPNHGQGKIWRLSAKKPALFKKSVPVTAKADRMAIPPQDVTRLLAILQTGDRFEKAIARSQLIGESFLEEVDHMITSPEPDLRLESVLIYTNAAVPLEDQKVRALLRDPDERVRKMAMIYTGRKMRVDLRDDLNEILSSGLIGPELFETYLATVQHIQPEFIENYQNRTGISADKQKQKLPDQFIETIIGNDDVPESIRSIALPFLEKSVEHQDLLCRLLQSAKDIQFKINLIKTLKQITSEKVAHSLLSLINNDQELPDVRAQAIEAMFYQDNTFCRNLKGLLSNSEEEDLVQYSLIKLLLKCRDDQKLVTEVTGYLELINNPTLQAVWQNANRSETVDLSYNQWIEAVDGTGNPVRGRLIFENYRSQCQSCHKIDGWGGAMGPDLSRIGSTKSRIQLMNSVLKPSLEIAPEWQGWYVIDQEGKMHIGRQIDVRENGAELMTLTGEFNDFMHPREFGVMDKSIMPTGLQNTMSLAEFNDLISYLESLK